MIKRTPAEWHTLINEQKQSSLSAAAFCRERGLCPKYFSKRRRQLCDDKSSSSCRAFVPVTIAKSIDPVRIELQLGEARVLTLPTSISPAWLAEFIHQLRP